MMMGFAGAPLSSRQRGALGALVADLSSAFGTRLLSVVVYGLDEASSDHDDIHSLALVEHMAADDLRPLVPLARGWGRRGLGVPLILTRHEFSRTLDAFPLEYGNIIASHVVIFGDDPFAGIEVADADWRRGCEQQAKSHVIHLREGYLETEGDPRRASRLIAASVPAFRTVLVNIVRLHRGKDRRAMFHNDADLAAEAETVIGLRAPLVAEILASARGVSTIAEPSLLLERYIQASEDVWRHVDANK
jgi:hypothetical protein